MQSTKMAATEKLFEYFTSLHLQELGDDWVKSVWDSHFTEVDLQDGVILDGGDQEPVEYLQSLRLEFIQWNTEKKDEGLWAAMAEKGISIEAFIAYLAHLVITGSKSSSSDKRILGCIAAQVYTKALLVPGSFAYRVFHPELYEKSVDYLKLFSALVPTEGVKRKKSNSPGTGSQPKRTSKAKRKRVTREHSSTQDDSEMVGRQDCSNDMDVDADDAEVEVIPPQVVKNSLRALLVDVVTLLESFPLKQSALSARHTVRILVGLCRLDIETFDGNFESRVPFRLKGIPALAFNGLFFLCTKLHGHVGIHTSFRELFPSMMFWVGDQPVQTINKQLQLIGEHSMNFIRYLMQQFDDDFQTHVRTLIQHMCTKVTDRAEYRTKVAQIVVTLAQQFKDEAYCKMVQWFYRFSKHSEIPRRTFAIEVVSVLISSPGRQVKDNIAEELLPYLSHRSLLEILIDRCSDKASVVRAKAIACFGECLNSRDEVIAGSVRDIMTPRVAGRQGQIPRLIKTPGFQDTADTVIVEDSTPRHTEETIAVEGSTIETEKTHEDQHGKGNPTPLHRVVLTPGYDPNLSDREGLFSMLRRRAKDVKLLVRKAALQALENAVRFEAPNFTPETLKVLSDHCRDPGLSARKQAMQSLTELMTDMCHYKSLQKHWVLGVLPLVLDRESTLSQKCFDILEDIILNNVVIKVRSTSDSHRLAWSLLGMIAEPESVDQRRYLRKACHHWARQGKIRPSLISALETHIGTDNNEAAWMLLAEIAPAAPKIGHSLLVNFWKEQEHQESTTEIMARALTVTKHVVKHLPSDDRKWLLENFKTRLLAFNSPPELISVTVGTLAKIYEIEYEGRNSGKLDWCHELLSGSDKYLSKVILQETCSNYDEEKVICHLFTLGEVVQLCPASVKKRIFLLVQSMIATPCIASFPASQPQPLSLNEHSHSSEPSVNTENGDFSNASHGSSGSSQGSQDSQGSQESQGSQDSQGSQFTQTSQASQPLTQFRGSKMSERVRAHAFISFGKLCLQHEGLAKKCIAALARELEVSTDPAIRNNVMIVMCDLCVRYTTTTNNYIGNIASVLKDPSPLLRKQTLTLVTRLLQEDFIKWKGPLFYRFISTILDECQDIRQFSEYCLIHMLLHRHPNILFQHFIECIFHFNDYTDHRIYNKFKQTDRDRKTFSLNGEGNKKKREKLYKFLLENMTDEHRFQIQSKVCQEILGGMVDGVLPYDNTTKDILRDSLNILSCKEIKLTSLRSHPTEDIASDAQEMAAAVAAVAKKTILTQVLKKNVIENIVPIVISLKHMMEGNRSPLLADLMKYLRELMKDYKNEVKEILLADKQLASEIEYDLKKFDEQQQALVQAMDAVVIQETVANVANGASPQTVPNRDVRVASPAVHCRSPRGPAMKDNVGSPRAGSSPTVPTPILQLVRSEAGTPARVGSLVTTAVMNSARKRMEGKDQEASAVMEQSNEMMDAAKTGTPQKRERSKSMDYRAISTPAVALGNITFHGEANMTFLPPSPIPEREPIQRMFDETMNDKENEETVVHLNFPPLGNEVLGPQGRMSDDQNSPLLDKAQSHKADNNLAKQTSAAQKDSTDKIESGQRTKATITRRKSNRKK